MNLPITVIRSRRRTLSLEIRPDCTVVVRAPLRCSEAEIRRFISEKEGWLLRHLEKMRSSLQNPASGAYLYNPVYDVSYGTDGTTPQPMAVTKDPMHDNYSPYSRQSFNSDAAFNAYVGTFNIPASNGGLAVNAGTFVTLSRASTSYDPQVIFKFSADPDNDGGLAVNNGVVNGYQMGGFTAHNVDDCTAYSDFNLFYFVKHQQSEMPVESIHFQSLIE